jgi:flagellar basal body rod protein FlgG
MPDGIASAANALHYWERRQEIVSNNLANASTDGFKAERVFARLVGDSTPVTDSATDFRAGTLKATGRALDLAMKNDGFLVVDTPRGERLARGGSFQLDAQGRLSLGDGSLLLGENGPIAVGSGDVTIDRTGNVAVDGKVIDRLRMERVPNGTRLQHDQGTTFVPDPSREPVDVDGREVQQGVLEESNVNTVDSMVDMIAVQRAYAAVQKTITTLDAIHGTISNELGKLKG